MKRITEEDIEAMRVDGFESSTIEQAEARLARQTRADFVCEQIRVAFAGAKLGNGIGLWQAQGLDDYEDAETCARYRADDEKEDWARLSSETLQRCYSSLSFFDADGMRFHLPAFLIHDLTEGDSSAVFHLTDLGEYGLAKFASLSRGQRLAVRAYLLHMLHDPECRFDHPNIERALKEYWGVS